MNPNVRVLVSPYIYLPTYPTPDWLLQDIRLLQSFCGRANHPFLAPPYLQSPYYCNTIARLLRNIRRPADPPLVCHTPYNIGDGNIV